MAKYPPKISSDIKELAKDLKDEFKLSDFEALTLALKAEQNDLFKKAFNVSTYDDYQPALIAIADALRHIQ